MNRREFGRSGLMGLAALAFGDPKRVARHASEASATQASDSRGYRYIHLDVFTDRRMQGNQLFVFVQPAGLDTDTMQTMTRESNLSECTFVFPPEQAGTDHRVRIFTRTAETPFAGHPTIGTAFALAHTGVLKPGLSRTTFGLGVGPINLDLDWKDGRLAFAWMTQLKPTFGKSVVDGAALAAALGLDAALVRLKPDATSATSTERGVRLQPDPAPAGQEVNCGSNFFIVPLPTRKAVDAAVLDRAKVDAVFAASGMQRRGIYIFSTERGQDDATAYSRLLGTGGIEDPATGSAVGPAGCFAAKYGFVPPALREPQGRPEQDRGADREISMTFLQGVLARRPSRLHVKVTMSGAEVTGVQVGGASVVVGEGSMAV
jgi:trans-2,3-dihydro-3-hydroxyanthranilate isomerase